MDVLGHLFDLGKLHKLLLGLLSHTLFQILFNGCKSHLCLFIGVKMLIKEIGLKLTRANKHSKGAWLFVGVFWRGRWYKLLIQFIILEIWLSHLFVIDFLFSNFITSLLFFNDFRVIIIKLFHGAISVNITARLSLTYTLITSDLFQINSSFIK